MGAPYLDVSDVLFDTDFCDSTLTCIRNAVATGNDGIGIETQTTIGFTAVVTSVDGQNLRRGDLGEHAAGSVMVVTKFRLRVAGAGYSADIVSWNGAQYTVTKINDYSRYGKGVIEATCELLPLAGYMTT